MFNQTIEEVEQGAQVLFSVAVLLPADAVRHHLPDTVQHQFHFPSDSLVQPDGAAHQHGDTQEGPYPLQVWGLRHTCFRAWRITKQPESGASK